jgi:hypothetical protein
VVQFWLGSQAAQNASDQETRLDRVAEILRQLPPLHGDLLAAVPILIVSTFPGGAARGGGAWFAPERHFPTVDVWLRATSQARAEAPPDEIRSLNYTRGIIGWKDFRFLEQAPPDGGDVVPIPLAILHEVGHCVDCHLGLTSPAQGSYRHGLAPYAGEIYSPPRPWELAAEAYARAFGAPNQMCRGGHAGGCSGCNARLQTDLLRTRAFQQVPNARTYLPHALDLTAPAARGGGARRGGARAARPAGETPPTSSADAPATAGPPARDTASLGREAP